MFSPPVEIQHTHTPDRLPMKFHPCFSPGRLSSATPQPKTPISGDADGRARSVPTPSLSAVADRVLYTPLFPLHLPPPQSGLSPTRGRGYVIWSEPLQMQPRVLPLPLQCSRSGGFPGVKLRLVEANPGCSSAGAVARRARGARRYPIKRSVGATRCQWAVIYHSPPPPFLTVLMAERLRRAVKAFCFSLPD